MDLSPITFEANLDPSDFFLQLAVILVAARIFSELAARLDIPTRAGLLGEEVERCERARVDEDRQEQAGVEDQGEDLVVELQVHEKAHDRDELDRRSPNVERCQENDHVLDAALCVVAGFDFWDGLSVGPEDFGLAQHEGWMWVRRAHSPH